MALNYSSTDAAIDDIGVKILVHGPAGVGKTVLAATLPGETLIIGAENGLLSLQPANQMRLFGASRNLPVVKIKNASELGEAYDLVAGPHGKHFESIAIDSLSEIAELVLASEMKQCKDPRKAYGTMQDTMTRYIRLFRDLPGKNVYMSAKQDREKDGEGIILFGPSMPGRVLTQGVAHFFDEVFALYVTPKDASGNTYRVLRTRPDVQFSAKDRSGALAELEEPNLAKIIAKIKNKTT